MAIWEHTYIRSCICLRICIYIYIFIEIYVFRGVEWLEYLEGRGWGLAGNKIAPTCAVVKTQICIKKLK